MRVENESSRNKIENETGVFLESLDFEIESRRSLIQLDATLLIVD